MRKTAGNMLGLINGKQVKNKLVRLKWGFESKISWKYFCALTPPSEDSSRDLIELPPCRN